MGKNHHHRPYSHNRDNLKEGRGVGVAYDGQQHISLMGLPVHVQRLRRRLRASCLDAAIAFDIPSSTACAKAKRYTGADLLDDMTADQLREAVAFVDRAIASGRWDAPLPVMSLPEAKRALATIHRLFPALAA